MRPDGLIVPHDRADVGPRLVLAGASLGTGNRGVEALARSVIESIVDDHVDAHLSVLDDGWGVRPAPDLGPDVDLVGVRWSRRLHRPESWARIRLAQALRPSSNVVATRIGAVDALLDISGGDSFTDLYGPARLAAVSAPKRAAIRAGTPLVLLPQTYGPFATARGRRSAERIIRSATIAMARDPWSHEQLVSLAGPDADRARLRQGVDVAFALGVRRPSPEAVTRVEGWAAGVTAGVNVSGLLVQPGAGERFGLAGDYVATMMDLVRRLIRAGARVVFVPHVHAPGGGGESDVLAIQRIREGLTAAERASTDVVPPDLGPAESKWCIAQFDWFVGSRMHATIAALSTGTPAAAYAYSDKTSGVFATCGMSDHVVDARRVAGGAAVEVLMASFLARGATRADLGRRAPAVVEASRAQVRDLLGEIIRWRATGGRVPPIT